MSQFAETVLREYNPIIRRNTPQKEVKYRIRVVQRKYKGLFKRLVDIREYLITERRFGFTKYGVYFDREELNHLIKCLSEARKEFF